MAAGAINSAGTHKNCITCYCNNATVTVQKLPEMHMGVVVLGHGEIRETGSAGRLAERG